MRSLIPADAYRIAKLRLALSLPFLGSVNQSANLGKGSLCLEVFIVQLYRSRQRPLRVLQFRYVLRPYPRLVMAHALWDVGVVEVDLVVAELVNHAARHRDARAIAIVIVANP